MELTREQVLRFRVHAQGLAAEPASRAAGKVPILDVGVQDTGPDGLGWALAVRGARPGTDDVAVVWSVRGAPHAYRREELARAVERLVPWSHADAASRIYDAAKPLAEAGLEAGVALAQVATAMRGLVDSGMVKGDVSTAVTPLLPEPFRRWCVPCGATHLYEQTFRLGAMFGGLQLQAGTSPPVLEPVTPWSFDTQQLVDLPATAPSSGDAPADELLLSLVHFVGPVGITDLAKFLDAPVKDVRARVKALVAAERLAEVTVEGAAALALASDIAALGGAGSEAPAVVRLLGPYDLFLQGRDRGLLVPDTGRHKGLWPVLGRPGAVLAGTDVVGTWRPRAAGKRLKVLVEPWTTWSKALDREVDAQSELLAAYRGVDYAGRA